MGSVQRMFCGFIGLGAWATLAMAQQLPLVPLGDQVNQPLLPTGITSSEVEMFGELVYLWNAPDGSNVVHFIGDFELQVGRRRLNAHEAVIWMSRRTFEGVEYSHFDIVLWRDARVVEAAGTVTRGPVLFVTLNAAGALRVSADLESTESSAHTVIYGRAERIREAMADQLGDTELLDTPLTVVEMGRRAERPALEPRPTISYRAQDTSIDTIDGRSVVTAIGDVYVFRGPAGGGEPLELRADAAVLYLREQAERKDTEEDEGDARPGRVQRGPEAESAPGVAGEVTGMGVGLDAGQVESVYLEGDIVLTSGDRMIRASRLYYDFARDQALILDAVVRTFEPKRSLPIYLRADMARQLSARKFQARDAKLTTSEFHTPHYHIGAQEITFVDRTQRQSGQALRPETVSGSYEMKQTTFNIGGVPILYWPYAKGNISQSESSLESVRMGYSDDFGAEFESKWQLFSLLGLERPVGFDGTLLLDYFSERGPGIGANLDYERDNSFGLFRGYYIHDTGTDNLGGRFRDEQPDTENRGRALLRHRQYLPGDWQLTLETSYISDKNFLEEYFEQEFDKGKEQETLLYLKKQVDNWAFTSLLQYRILDFVTTTERLPDFSFHLVGEPIGNFASFFSENRGGWVRYRPADRNLIQNILRGGREDGSGTVARADTRQEIDVPLTLGDFKLVPFGSVRGTAWDDSVDMGGAQRGFGTFGLRGSMYAWKAFPNVASELLDIHGLRHIVKLDMVAWGAGSNVDSQELFPFDENIEGIADVDGVSLGLRQRLQTKRGGPGRQRNVDLLIFDVELGAFNDAESDEITNGFTSYSRPENSVSRNYLNTAVVYRVNDSTDLASEMNYDINDGEVDVFTLTLAVERTPRLSYLIGYRFIEEIDSNLLGLGMNYRISEKYILAVREEFDLERGETAEFDVGIIRKFPRWYVGLTFALDQVEDDFGVSISAWPEGLPRAAMGSRRFTGLATTTGIRPGY